jgi:ClpP class serine protease
MVDIIERHADGVRMSADEIAIAIGRAAPEAAVDTIAGAPARLEPRMQIVNTTAIVPVRGILARYADQVNSISQPQGRSAESVQDDLRAALADPKVDRVVMRLDSPGGMVNGTAETGAVIAALQAAGKPVFAFVDGLCASAAYWIAASCDSITASSPSAQVGSIGVMGSVVERVSPKGMKITTLRSSPLKAPGGEKVTSEQMASLQKNINDLASNFYAHVAQSRGLDVASPEYAAAITGEAFTASVAKTLGLIDSIAAWDSFLAGVMGTNALAAGTPPVANHAAQKAASSPDTRQKPDTMKITAQVLLALLASAPEHLALISAMASGDTVKGVEPATEAEIRAAITATQQKAISDKLAALEAQVIADGKAHTAALVAKDAELTALKAQYAKDQKVIALGAGAAKDPGADHTGASASDDNKLKAEWEALTPSQKMGFCDDFAGFKAWRVNAHRDHSATVSATADKEA